MNNNNNNTSARATFGKMKKFVTSIFDSYGLAYYWNTDGKMKKMAKQKNEFPYP